MAATFRPVEARQRLSGVILTTALIAVAAANGGYFGLASAAAALAASVAATQLLILGVAPLRPMLFALSASLFVLSLWEVIRGQQPTPRTMLYALGLREAADESATPPEPVYLVTRRTP